MGQAAAYFITFSCYGTHMHGDEAGSVDRSHHTLGSPMLPSDPARLRRELLLMNQAAYKLSPNDRGLVLCAVKEVCAHRGWTLLATHVRSTHVHVIAQGANSPETMMQALKAYASRKLGVKGKRWARHGSTRYLWKDDDVKAAVKYVVEEQGEPMTAYCIWSRVQSAP